LYENTPMRFKKTTPVRQCLRILENKKEFNHLDALITITAPMFLNTNRTIALKKLIASFRDFKNNNKKKMYHVGVLKKNWRSDNVDTLFL